MGRYVRTLLVALTLAVCTTLAGAAETNGRFDLIGPRIDVRVSRGDQTLPIASVPNLQPGDRIWIHPDLPASQSVKYLLICAFLRGTTNPPPDSWFLRFNTWDRQVHEEGVFVTVPPEAQQVVLFMAPETGGDFSTLRSAVQGRPGVFVRASQDLAEAGFEQARIEKYMASIRRVPASDPAELEKRSDLLARTLALKPNEACFKRPVDVQFTCLTQTGTQTLLDDGHGQSIVNALSSGPGSDFINAASYTSLAGGGVYSAYVGAVVDLFRILGNLHTAKYLYIPAIAFPQGDLLNLRLNTPPSFHNPKSVLVIGLPSVQKATPPPLRPANAEQIVCLLRPTVVVPIEGAPLVFSTEFAHDLRLHLLTPHDSPAEPDLPLAPDAYQGGLVLQGSHESRTELRDQPPSAAGSRMGSAGSVKAGAAADALGKPTSPEPVTVPATIVGKWGFDTFSGPTVTLQQLPGKNWRILPENAKDSSTPNALIAGRSEQLTITSTGTACVHTITAEGLEGIGTAQLQFSPEASSETPNLLTVTLPLQNATEPGALHLRIQQYAQPRPDELATRTFTEPAAVSSLTLHAGDSALQLTGTHLREIRRVQVGDLAFAPAADAASDSTAERFTLPKNMNGSAAKAGEHLTAEISLVDGRKLEVPFTVAAARPTPLLLSRTVTPPAPEGITLRGDHDMPLSSTLAFTLKTHAAFPRDGQVEIETVDGTLHTTLTLAPAGGLLLQDPHTIIATLDPQRAMGTSAFGPLQVRISLPKPDGRHDSEETTDVSSDWIPLVTLVRLPVLTGLVCPADPTAPCSLNGSNLFLIQAVSADPTFSQQDTIPDGFTGSSVTVPHTNTGTLFLHLRDDPDAEAIIVLPESSTPAPKPSTGRLHARPTTASPPAGAGAKLSEK